MDTLFWGSYLMATRSRSAIRPFLFMGRSRQDALLLCSETSKMADWCHAASMSSCHTRRSECI